MEVIIYKEINKELEEIWKTEKIGQESNYCSNLKWCKIWWKHFKNKNKKLNIIVIREKGDVKLIAPFYKEKKILKLIGTDQDFVDEFRIIFKNKKYLKKLYEVIFMEGLRIHFKFINTESLEFIELYKYLYEKKILFCSKVVDLKPISEIVKLHEVNVKNKKMRDDINRIKRKIELDEKIIFTLEEDKKNEIFETFKDFHTDRWEFSMFKKNKILDFFKEMYEKNEQCIVSSLKQGDKFISLHFGYRVGKQKMWSAIPTFNKEYQNYSPGKVFLFECLKYLKGADEIEHFDFGRGAEKYKFWFSTKSETLVNIKTYQEIKFPIFNRYISIVLKKIWEKYGV